VVQLTQLVSPD